METDHFMNLMSNLLNIRKCAVHQSWNIKRNANGILITGDIHEIAFSEIMKLLIKKYPCFYVRCNLKEGYINIH